MKKPPDALLFLAFAAMLLVCAMVLILTGHPVPTWLTAVMYAVLLAAGVVVVPGVGAAAAVASELRNRLADTPIPVVPTYQAAAVIPPAAATAPPVEPIPPVTTP